MNLMKWQPMSEVMELSDLLDRTFQRNGVHRAQSRVPRLALDIYETEENLVLRAYLPGVKKEDISVEFEDQLLSVSAEVREPDLPEGASGLLRESLHGKVSRTIKVSHRLNVEESKGTFVDGVLEVTFPKAVEARRKSIIIE